MSVNCFHNAFFDLVIIFLVCIRFRKSGAGGVTHLSPSSDDLNLENLKDVINWILIGSDGLQVIPGSAPKSKCKWRKEFVAVAGLEPAHPREKQLLMW